MESSEKGALRIFYGDKVLWVIIVMLSIISVLLVFSSTAKMAYDITESGSPLKFLATQLGYLAVSLLCVVILHRFSAKMYGQFSWWIWGICIALTVAAYFAGSMTNGAARWLPLGFISIQPSEFLKVATVLHLSAMLSRPGIQNKNLTLFPTLNKKDKVKNTKILKEATLPIMMPILASMAVIVSAHTSSAILIFIVSIFILYMAGIKKIEIAKFIALIILVGGAFYLLGMGRSDTAGGRLTTWATTLTTNRQDVRIEDVTDTERSMVAIQYGGLLGKGAGQSAMRVEMIHPESDYAFAFFVEEYGIILSLLLLLLYAWIFFRAMWIFERCRDPFRELLVLSLALLILVQALIHVMVSVNLFPETGQILPLVSRGGSALFSTYMAFMLMLSISAKNEQTPKPKSAPRGTQSR